MSLRKLTITGAVLALALAGAAAPVHGYFQTHGFFKASDKYKDWYHETVWLQDTRAEERQRGIVMAAIITDTSVKYPYPEKPLAMTENMWRASTTDIEAGRSDWYDVEVVRQRAEVEEYPPAMDFLAWMYQEGQGVDRDYRKAFMWYERAKLAGELDLSGSPAKIFPRMNPAEQYLAQLQLADDIERAKRAAKRPDDRNLRSVTEDFETVKLHVLPEQRETTQQRKRQQLERRRQRENGG